MKRSVLALALAVLIVTGCGGGRRGTESAFRTAEAGPPTADAGVQMADGGSRAGAGTTPVSAAPHASQPAALDKPSPSTLPTQVPDLFVPAASTLPVASLLPLSSSQERWIDVDLSQQRLIAYEDATPIRAFVISSGAPGYETVTGRFKIYAKYEVIDLYGPDFFRPAVPYVMMFYPHFALHAATWHDDFGRPVSRGCINLRVEDAAWLYKWAEIGTRVEIVHWR